MSDRLKQLFIESKNKKKTDINKEFVCEMWDGVKVYLVDGDRVRNDKNVEFIGGGNHPADTDPKNPTGMDCPKDEVWVEKMLDPKEQIFILVHELTEYLQMRYHGLKYEKAHPIANSIEGAARAMAKKIGLVK